MKKLIFFSIILTLFSAQEERPEIHCKHFFYGYPFGTPKTNDLIIRDSYAMSNNDDTKFADWLSFRLDTNSINGPKRSRKWKKDPWLESDETLEPSDYKDANKTLKTDRGHQAPLGSLDGYDSYFESNYLSNITPQKSDLNQGAWKKLEDKVRLLVKKHNEIFVMTGPLYEKEMPKLPKADEEHKVPSGYWKIIGRKVSKNEVVATGFIFKQEAPRSYPLKNAIVSIDEIEKRSKLDFFWLLPKSKETALEQKANSEWIKEVL